ncbi:NAD(P)-binding protein [Conidiobolus coronatus NRRL 28638]|uniref:NAD(P)-binding protein n=1 Tax=Conidiobolus coronatus (strain ATCC 28846 / CBS 209.66 / NRRL 28638) TaxID=796925 RepID=A0A137P8Y6_CONC2|nr:NAD(P)-binding protein [Conidiobolus coronatus NRRL 28638]|eukprot:KXN71463.1 NAD(P)-binding protein [Conidiobolus coronatus NRRL 28638]
MISGLYPAFQPTSYPAVPGLEGVAQVVEVGKSVKSIKTGQRVVIVPAKSQKGITKEGTWTQYGVYSEENLFVVPNNVPDEIAAQAFINPVTAYGLLDKINAPKGEYIIQTAAASVLGRILIQFAKSRGIKTINLVRRGKGAYGAVDTVGGKIGLILSHSVKDEGLILLYGGLGGLEVSVSTVELIFRNIHYTGFYLTKYVIDLDKEEFRKIFNEVFDLLNNGFKPFTGDKYPLDQVSDAIHQSLKPGRGGKVLLVHN